MNGIDLIAIEREEQIFKHGRTVTQDAIVNRNGQIAHAIGYLVAETWGEFLTEDDVIKKHCPRDWNPEMWAKMIRKSHLQRVVIAGALCAAEYDRQMETSIKNGKANAQALAQEIRKFGPLPVEVPPKEQPPRCVQFQTTQGVFLAVYVPTGIRTTDFHLHHDTMLQYLTWTNGHPKDAITVPDTRLRIIGIATELNSETLGRIFGINAATLRGNAKYLLDDYEIIAGPNVLILECN